MNILSTKHKTDTRTILLFIAMSLSFLSVSAQEKAVQPEPDSVFYNPLMIAMLSIASLLLLVIIVFAGMLSASAAYKAEKDRSAGKIIKTILLLIFLSSGSLYAQTEAPVVLHEGSSYWGIDSLTFYTMLTIIAAEIYVIWFFYDLSMRLLGIPEKLEREAEEREKALANEPSFLEKINASVAIEQEADIMFDHDYDGIKELDNNLPPWWKYGFVVTVIFGFIYLVHYQVLGTGQSPDQEYRSQIAQGKADVEAYRAKAANLVDENNATLLTDQASLESGRAIYIENCAPCHGKSGEGNVGPNLTDDYWIHKGGVKDIFRTIKFGWPEKGMKSWEQDLGAKQIHEVTSFIKSLRGTNPANQKEKQGDLYVETAGSDSTKIIAKDSTQVLDSTQVAGKK